MNRHGMILLAILAVVISVFASAGRVTIAPDRMLEVDGKRIFPIGLYENPKDDAVLDEVARSGFNLVHSSSAKEELDRLYSRGLYAWVNVGGSIDLGPDGKGSDEGLRNLAAACAQHPALLVWEVPDEALWNCWLQAYAGSEPLLERVSKFQDLVKARSAGFVAGYKAMKQIDPDHPIWANHAALNTIEDLAAFNAGADICGADEYPVLPHPTKPFDVSRLLLGLTGTITERMQAAAPGKPIWMVLQGVGWCDFDGLFGKKDPNGQKPTFEESRFMAYDVIARGARAILYWGTSYIEKDSQLWKDLMRLARELADSQALLSAPDTAIPAKVGASIFLFSVDGQVQVLGKDLNGETWWIVANELPIELSYTIDGLQSLDGKVYVDPAVGCEATVSGGRLALPIKPYGVHILRPKK